MHKRTILTALLALLAFAIPAAGASASSSGAIVFSWVRVESRGAEGGEGEEVAKAPEGGLYAARNGHFNQLTENPLDQQPAFSADGRSIVFVRSGDIYSMRADGSGQRALTTGPELDSRPRFSPNGRFVLFERRTAGGAPRDLYTVGAGGGRLGALTKTPDDEHDATFAPDGRAIVYVRSVAGAGDSADDLYSVRPSGAGLARLTRTARIDEFAPRYYAGGIAYSRGESSEGDSAYADIFTMRRDGSRPRQLIAGAGSAYIEDVTPNGRLLLFRRDQGLWVKPLPGRRGRVGRARKLIQLADGSHTNAVFSSNSREVAAFVATDEGETLSAIDVASGRTEELAEGFGSEGGGVTSTIGSTIAWQPVH